MHPDNAQPTPSPLIEQLAAEPPALKDEFQERSLRRRRASLFMAAGGITGVVALLVLGVLLGPIEDHPLWKSWALLMAAASACAIAGVAIAPFHDHRPASASREHRATLEGACVLEPELRGLLAQWLAEGRELSESDVTRIHNAVLEAQAETKAPPIHEIAHPPGSNAA